VRRAALEERTRLSRELHDGLAQDLWLAKLKIGRLSAMPATSSREAKAVCDELTGAIDAGLADARQAVMALRLGSEPAVSLRELMAHYVDDFGDRFGLRAEFDCEGELPRLTPRAEAELLRIAQEALNNVVRHADATVVRVRAGVVDSNLELAGRRQWRGVRAYRGQGRLRSVWLRCASGQRSSVASSRSIRDRRTAPGSGSACH
jgi:two-component system nitrate/nitrite sensor histidine kinase NarX